MSSFPKFFRVFVSASLQKLSTTIHSQSTDCLVDCKDFFRRASFLLLPKLTVIIEISILEDANNYYINLKDNGKGLPTDFNINDIKSEKEYPLSGTLTVRGIKKEIETTAKVTLSDGKIN